MKLAPMGKTTWDKMNKEFPNFCKELFKDSKSKLREPFYLGKKAKKELKKLIIDKQR